MPILRIRRSLALGAMVLCPFAVSELAAQRTPPRTSPGHRHASATADSADAVATVAGFHAAMARADSVAVLAALAPDVVIMEGGDSETLSDYRSHHLAADIAYARAIAAVSTLVRVVVRGDVAWVASTSVVDGRMNDRRVNSAGAELIVLSRTNAASPWAIRAVHWSSHRRPT